MKLTAKTEYALLALIYLARQANDHFETVDRIAQAQGIPPKFLEQLMLQLKRAKVVTSQKGQGGGYKLNRSPSRISIAEIVRLFDGALAPTESVSRYFYESTPIEKEDKMIMLLKGIRDYISDRLENTTLDDVK
ncbi:MAG: Rrf2 family transcriptional regulator [Candidatus Delongbacteria bacterium]|nr:Rrf2 family transcriptional regulator [Candidatus Delongbacteria bacterium]